MTLTSDCNEEFFDARSDIGCAPLDVDLLSDDDSDDGDDYVPCEAAPIVANDGTHSNHLEAVAEPSISMKRAKSGGQLGNLNRLSLMRSTSDTDIASKSDVRTLLDCDTGSVLKVKSASSDMEQTAAQYRKQEAEKQAQGIVRYR